MASAPVMGQAEGALSRAAALVAGARQDLTQLNGELAQHLETARTIWSGRGGSAFWQLGQAWHERQATIVGALERFESSLRATEHDNVRTDDEQSSTFARQRQRLG